MEPVKWQDDQEVIKCPKCQSEFNFFNRRHHCRMCGLVVCGQCSDNFIKYIDGTYIVPRPGSPPPDPEDDHRTCLSCLREHNLLRRAIESSSLTVVPTMQQRMIQRAIQDNDNDSAVLTNCPVCDLILTKMDEETQCQHVDSCINNAAAIEPSHHHRKRMIVSTVSEKMSATMGDCMICYEEFLPEQRIGRLECMCVFHEPCIQEWFSRKGVGSCPLHNQSD